MLEPMLKIAIKNRQIIDSFKMNDYKRKSQK